jgi:hypothetical protein
MTMKHAARLLTVGLFAASVFALFVSADTTTFDSGSYYIVSIGQIQTNVAQLAATAKSLDIPVLTVEGGSLAADRDTESIGELLGGDRLLVIDGDRFYLREIDGSLAYVVRPAYLGYELVIVPTQGIDRMEGLVSLLTALQQMGISGVNLSVDLWSIPAYESGALKGPAAPAGLAIDSDLYGLVVAPDWFSYAEAHNLTQVGLRVEVIAEKVPGGSVPAEFAAYVTSETETLAKLVLPIEDLVALAQDSGIGYVRPAYQAVAP